LKIKLDKNKDKDKDKDTSNKVSFKKKSFFLGEQSKSLIEENKNINNQKMEKILIETNETNHSGGHKRKSYYYSNKIVNKNNNENYFKAALKKNNFDKIVEEKENDKDKEQNGKTERKKLKKQDSKIPLKNNNAITSKFLKIKIQKENSRVMIKHQSHSKQGIDILKEHIKNKLPDKKDETPNDHRVNLGKEKNKKEKNKKIRKKKSNEKDNKDSDTEEKKIAKTPNRRASGFSFKKKNKRKNTEKQDNNSDQKTLKTNKTKKDKEKDNISRSNFSLKDSNNNNNIKAKIKLNNSLTRKDLVLLRNTYDNKDNVERLAKFIRRKRSISVNLDKSILVEVAKTLKENEHDNKPKENTRLKTNTNTNLNTISIGNMGKGKKLNKKNFDFEKALKKNSKKMQFNLFSKDKFTNSEIINSDYLKYTLNCMELIIDIDMEKQTRLKNKINFNFPKPKKKNSIKKRIALFDLDETLVHCTGDIKVKKEKYQHVIEIKLPGKQAVQVGINLRPLWKQTLKLIKKYYHIVIYTASHQAYADSVLDFMDPKKKYFKYRLYRNNCSLIDVEGAKFYVKDLDILNEYYDLKDIVIIDNSVLSFAFHLHNGIPIVPYYDEDKDGSLYVVGLYLNHIFPENDLREANKTQINLDSFLEEAKKLKEEEEENVIDEEPDDEEEEKSINNSNKSDKEKQEGKEKEGQSDDEKKVSDKKVCLNAKRRTCFDFPIDNQRRESHDSTQKKLISHSKLLNMYYEVNDESSKSIKDQISDANLEDKKSVENLNGENNKENGKNNDNAFIVNSGNGEIECKSDPGYPLIDQNNNYNSDNDSVSDDNIPVLKRGFTIIEEPDNKIKNYMITGKLNYIRSNFYNNFKI
jgi:CTD small phosphatase-like protein 2